MRRYTFAQIELMFYMSRKVHFRTAAHEIDWQSKAIAGRMGQAFQGITM